MCDALYLVRRYQNVGGTYYLHLQGGSVPLWYISTYPTNHMVLDPSRP